jgi:hypothetical protein
MFWYEDEVKRLVAIGLETGQKAETIFYGSSSIRLWGSLSTDFSDLRPVNLGFGGSTLAACVWFFDRVMTGYQPKRLIVYAGDNDLGDGRHPEEVFIFFQQLAAHAQARFGNMPCYFISLKPSLNRWHLVGQFKFANSLIEAEIKSKLPNWGYIDLFNDMIGADMRPKKELYQEDGLHLSKAGYEVWRTAVANRINAD